MRFSVAVLISLFQLFPNEAITFARQGPRRTRAVQGINEIPRPQSFKPNVPKECEEIGICNDVPEYPSEYMSQLIDQINRDNQTQFNVDIIELNQRSGLEEENLKLCDAKSMLYSPLAARSVNGKKWYYIVNTKNDEPVQTYHVEVCNKQYGKCKNVASFALGNEGYCKQKYILRRM